MESGNQIEMSISYIRHQNSAEPGVRGKGIASLMFSIPVANCTSLSKPSPKPACGTGRQRNTNKVHHFSVKVRRFPKYKMRFFKAFHNLWCGEYGFVRLGDKWYPTRYLADNPEFEPFQLHQKPLNDGPSIIIHSVLRHQCYTP